MKKIFLLLVLLLLTGCSSINDSNLDKIINDTLTSDIKIANVDRKGYRYYLPKGLTIRSNDSYNDIIMSDKYTFYLYVDILSYHSKVKFNYTENEQAYYSKKLNYNDKLGYIEINYLKSNQYLIEIMYNYAKIEVVGYSNDIKNIVAYLMSIITSITYNDNIINNYLSNEEEYLKEEKFDIFEIVGSDNYLEFTTDDNESEGRKDPDYVN